MYARRVMYAGGLAVLMASGLWAAKPAAGTGEPAAPRPSRAGLTKPWNEMKTLTDKEKTRIVEIHRKVVDQIHEIEAKERQDIMAVLTEPQRKEVAEIEARDRQEAKERRTHSPTTRPTGSGSAANAAGGR